MVKDGASGVMIRVEQSANSMVESESESAHGVAHTLEGRGGHRHILSYLPSLEREKAEAPSQRPALLRCALLPLSLLYLSSSSSSLSHSSSFAASTSTSHYVVSTHPSSQTPPRPTLLYSTLLYSTRHYSAA
jgi:hypothetical protein